MPEGFSPELSQQNINPEVAIPGVSERLAILRAKGVGRPIVIDVIDEDGQRSSEPQYVGHILPTDNDGHFHVVILDNGLVGSVGAQYANSGATLHGRYFEIYEGNQTLPFTAGTTKAAIFQNLVRDSRSHGGAMYATSDNPAQQDKIRMAIKDGLGQVNRIFREHVQARQAIGEYFIAAVDQALPAR